ncbi:DMT family transporter [Streptomyces abyssomicinicus]|uniref:DMT family transporter n=1 Tax=Streptomyces abyssomicinicus TaxID=574929 RepID=UPI001583332E|nr:DMT family transporter [Streptomyces abyssomicinicus]
MISVLFAVLTALSNATATVFQRQAARTIPDEQAMRLSLFGRLLRQKVWLAGIGLVIVAAVCQAVALSTGPIALVQPIFVLELPATLLIAGLLTRTAVRPRLWAGVAAVTCGLAVGLAAADPVGGHGGVDGGTWVAALVATAAFEAALLTAARTARGDLRAALLGLAAACGYSLTAALMKDAMARLDSGGVAALLTSWQVYATAVVGVGALFLLQNALQAGSLVAVQPMLTLGDALISVCYGVTLFGEHVRTGWWLLPQLAGLSLIAVGCVVLARSPLAAGEREPAGGAAAGTEPE